MFKSGVSLDKIIGTLSKPFKSKNKRRFEEFIDVIARNKAQNLTDFTSEEIERFLVKPCDMSLVTPLHVAAMQESDAILEHLLTYCSDVDVPDCNGTTPLLCAIAAGEMAKVRLLMEHGANPNVLHMDGFSPIIDVINQENSALLEYLLDNGADPNLCVTTEPTYLLHVACGIGSVPLIRSLCSHGAKLDTYDYYGQCPIHIVAAQDNIVALMYLISEGDDINRPDQLGNTPLYYAKQCGATKVEKYLMTLDAKESINFNGSHEETESKSDVPKAAF